MRGRRAAAAMVLTTAVAGCGQNLQSLLPANVLATGSLASGAGSAESRGGTAQPSEAAQQASAAPATPAPHPSTAAAAPAVGPTGEGLVSSALASVAGAFAPSATVHAEPPVEVYSRVARGILGCWFGPVGGMRRSHIFHADVAPEHKGGESEIVLHVREESGAPSPRALRAYRVSISRMGDGSRAVAENLRFPEAMGAAMQADVARWAHGRGGCSDAVVSKAPEPPPAKAERKAERKKAKKRAPVAARQLAAKAVTKE